jgi:hypothetical protein
VLPLLIPVLVSVRLLTTDPEAGDGNSLRPLQHL